MQPYFNATGNCIAPVFEAQWKDFIGQFGYTGRSVRPDNGHGSPSKESDPLSSEGADILGLNP